MSRPPLIAVSLASGVALAYQILLLRLFSIVQFHHTAYMVISLALLGYGASGSALTLWRRRWMARFEATFSLSLTLFGVTAVACFALAQRIGIHPEELLWNPRQLAWLLVIYLLLAVPFFFVGVAVGSALMRFPATRVYAVDLVGAGVGAGLVVALLWLMMPGGVLRLLASAALVAALIADLELGRGSLRRLGATLVVLVLVWAAPAGWVEPRPSEYKGLTQALRVHGTRLAQQRSSPLSLVSVVESPEVPLRHAPGLSLAVPAEPPEQIGLFLDAEALVPIVRWQQGSPRLQYLAYSTPALPYALAGPARVLVLGAGGGEEVARARHFGAESVVAVEINRDIVDLVQDDYAEFSGDLYRRPEVEVALGDIRGFAARDDRQFDLVVLSHVGGYGGGGPALASLAEDYLLTVEAFDTYLDLVAPGGFLTATVFVSNPPRGLLKLTATAIAALERRQVATPGDRLAVIRSWQTATLVVKRGPMTAEETARLRAFARDRLFDVVHLSGMDPGEANRRNRLPRQLGSILPHQAIAQLLGDGRDDFLDRYKFSVRPATDDRPFFHQFFRWRALPEIAAARGSGGLSLLEAGYLVLIATLAVTVVSALALILAPLGGLNRATVAASRARVGLYFAALGTGFLLLEVALLQRLILVLHHPVYAAAAVIATLLIFAGLGSASAPAVEARLGRRTIPLIAVGIVVLGASVAAALALLSSSAAGAPMPVRLGLSVALVAPLAYLLGMPFPLGIHHLKSASEELVPWAWAVNGCASVVSPVLATLVAVHWGFQSVVVLALLAYGAVGAIGLERPDAEPAAS